MPVQALPCPFCGGKQCDEDGEYIVISHDSWSCPMAAASGEVYQCIKQSDLSEWNERADIKEAGQPAHNSQSNQCHEDIEKYYTDES